MIRRERRWKSPSMVSRPSPSSGIRSPKPPSRQREVVRVGDEDAVVGLRADHEDDARGEHAEAEHRAVALVGVEQQRERVGDHRGACGGREGSTSPGGNGAGARSSVRRSKATRRDRVGGDGRRAGQ